MKWLFFQTMIASLIFFPTKEYSALPKDYGLAYEEVTVQARDGARLVGWFIPAENAAQVFYILHGNAGNMGDRLFKAREWVKRGFSVFMLDYRSYGKSAGNIRSEKDLYDDAKAGLEWLRDTKRISDANVILYGESIGSAPAIYLGIRDHFAAIFLEAPFTSLPDAAKIHYPFVPSFILNEFLLNNLEKISQLKSPLFIFHGDQDEICPATMGEKLFEKANQPKEIFKIKNGHHNDLPDVAGQEFYDRAIQFLIQQKERL